MKNRILELGKELKAYVVLTGRNAYLQEGAFTEPWFGLASLADIAREVLGEEILHGVETWTSQITNEDLLKVAERLIEKEGGVAWDFEEKVIRATDYIRRQQSKAA